MKVSDILTRDVGTTRPGESLKEAAQTMLIKDCGCLPVLDPQLKVVGIVTDRDICLTAGAEDRPLSDIPVSRAMSREVFFCREDDEIEEAEETMRKHAVRRLPVVDALGKLAGVLALDDLAMEFLKEHSLIKKKLSDERIVETLAVVCSKQVPKPVVGVKEGSS